MQLHKPSKTDAPACLIAMLYACKCNPIVTCAKYKSIIITCDYTLTKQTNPGLDGGQNCYKKATKNTQGLKKAHEDIKVWFLCEV